MKLKINDDLWLVFLLTFLTVGYIWVKHLEKMEQKYNKTISSDVVSLGQ